MIENVVAKQLADYINDNNLSEVFQETPLIRVYNDIALSIDNRKSVILVLLDLSAAFDTVDHSCCVQDCQFVLAFVTWQLTGSIQSYLSNHTQFVQVNDGISDVQNLVYGVPQGSGIRPMLYSLYTVPLGIIARSHGLSYHFYTDDSQLYFNTLQNFIFREYVLT